MVPWQGDQIGWFFLQLGYFWKFIGIFWKTEVTPKWWHFGATFCSGNVSTFYLNKQFLNMFYYLMVSKVGLCRCLGFQVELWSIDILAFFGLETVWATFQELGNFFQSSGHPVHWKLLSIFWHYSGSTWTLPILHVNWLGCLIQGTLTEGEGSVQLTSLYYLVLINCFWYWEHHLLFYKTSYINEEVNCTEPSLSAIVSCLINWAKKIVVMLV